MALIQSMDWPLAIPQLTKYTTSIPKIMANWLSETKRPRILAGAISPMYTGLMAEASPTPIPPTTRYTLNTIKRAILGSPSLKNNVSGKADPRADKKNKKAASIKECLRPKREDNKPEMAPPIIQPISALEVVAPWIKALRP